jgi:hypothetical protein
MVLGRRQESQGAEDNSATFDTTCASLAVSAGVNVLALQRMLGHTSAKMTLDTYADLFDDDLDAVAVTLHARSHRKVCPKCAHRVPKRHRRNMKTAA